MAAKTEHRANLTAMAEEIFGITTIAWQMRQQNRDTGGWDLSETEYLTLDLLTRHGTMNVGQLQRQIGVLPAQMSRIVRALEGKFDAPLIQGAINPDDKRKIDLTLTDTGRQARDEFRAARLEQSVQILSNMSPEDVEEFMRVIRKIRKVMAQSVKPGD